MSSSTTIADVATKIASVANKGAVSASITTSGGSYTIPAGYHNGSGKVTGPTLAALIGTNVTLASAANLLSGYTAYGKNGTKYTGSMTNNGAWTSTPTTSGNVTIPAGYHNGSGYVNTASVYSAAKVATSTYTLATEGVWCNESVDGKSVSYSATKGKYIFVGVYAGHHNSSETPAAFTISRGTQKNIYHKTASSGVMRSRVRIAEVMMSAAGTISCSYSTGAAEHHYAFLYMAVISIT